jgi:hypothetical protein
VIPIFVQTAGHVIDVSKITHAVCGPKIVTIHFVGGTKARLGIDEAHQLMLELSELSANKVLVARRAREVAA